MNLLIPDKRPRIRQKVQALDQRTITVCPIRAATDRNLTPMELRALLVYCSYTNKAGVAWVGLERIGKDLSVSKPRAHVLIKALDAKGYIKTLHKGFSGVCANTRRVMFDPSISETDAAAISGELAPYQVEQQAKERQAMEMKQAKRKTRRKPIEKSNQTINANSVNLSDPAGCDDALVELEDYTSTAFAHIDADILALAIASLGDKPHTTANIEAAIEHLLR